MAERAHLDIKEEIWKAVRLHGVGSKMQFSVVATSAGCIRNVLALRALARSRGEMLSKKDKDCSASFVDK